MRKLASIQKIVSVNPIEGADAIERIQVLGWQLVAKKGEFKPGDWCVYCETDSILPEKPEFEFLRNKQFRIKTIRLRGVISQGIAFPISILQNLGVNLTVMNEGDEVTDVLGITKYEPVMPVRIGGDTKGNFPSFIPKTNETRLQTIPNFINRNGDIRVYVSEKLDGTSSTFYVNEKNFGVCSHNLEIKRSDNNTIWQIAKKYDIEEKLLSYNMNISIQGEICGPEIQKNKLKLKEHKLFIFNVFDIDHYRYYDFDELMEFCEKNKFEVVPILYRDIKISDFPDVESWVNLSIGKSVFGNMNREGIVVRSMKETSDFETGRVSFKAINPNFLLENNE